MGFNAIVYSIFIAIISSKISSKIVGIGLQCRRDKLCESLLALEWCKSWGVARVKAASPV